MFAADNRLPGGLWGYTRTRTSGSSAGAPGLTQAIVCQRLDADARPAHWRCVSTYNRPVRIITINVNGIRAAARKGLFHWLRRQRADVVCLQELKAQTAQLGDRVFWPPSFHCHYLPAERKGYSGVGLFSRARPDQLIEGLGWRAFDEEGRWIEARFGKLSVVSLYLPSGSHSEERQQFKFEAMQRLRPYLLELRENGREYLVCGDWNIAHRRIDLRNWRSNQKNSGFLPEERQWMDEIFGAVGYVDTFRRINPEPDQYTWWSNRGRAWEKNVGWRIDYQVGTPGIAALATSAAIYKRKRFSDHAPLIIDYDYEI